MKYRIYPTLLNAFADYRNNENDENRQKLLNRINRISDFSADIMAKFREGIKFENAVLLSIQNSYDPQIIEQAKALLPARKNIQQKVSFNHNQVRFYGIADVVGERKVMDIKTTSKYFPEKYRNNFQNLYLYALRNFGYEEMHYIIYDFDKIQVESYTLADLDLEKMFFEIDMFVNFLEENRNFITDKKIFIIPTELFQ